MWKQRQPEIEKIKSPQRKQVRLLKPSTVKWTNRLLERTQGQKIPLRMVKRPSLLPPLQVKTIKMGEGVRKRSQIQVPFVEIKVIIRTRSWKTKAT